MFCLILLITLRTCVRANQNLLDIKPANIMIFDDEESIVSVTVKIHENITSAINSSVTNAKVRDKSLAEITSVEDDFVTSTDNSNDSEYIFGLRIVGTKIGRTLAVFNFTNNGNASLDLTVSNTLTVVRRRTIFDNILSYLLGLLVVINNFGFGCNFDYTIGKELVKTPKPVLVGLACQFIILPSVAFVLGWFLISNHALAFGLLTLGCVPGGGLAPVWCSLLGGDVTISLCLTLLTNVLALIMIPLWLVLLGPLYLDNKTMIPFIDLAVFSLIPIIPILLGIGIRKCTSMRARNKVIEFAVRSVRPFSAVLFLFCVTYAAIVNFYLLWDFIQDWKASITAVFLPWAGGALSRAVASVLKLSVVQAKTITLEMISINSALAVVLLKNTLPQPEADISSVLPLLSLIVSQLPLFLTGFYSIMKTLTDTSKANHGTDDTDVDLHDSNNGSDEHHEMQKLNQVST